MSMGYGVICACVFAMCLVRLVDAGDLVVVVNASSGVDRLSREQVVNIFLGRYRQYPSGLVALPIDQPDDGPLKAEFYRLLVDKDLAQINAYWARLIFSGRTRPPHNARNSNELLRILTSNVGAITYMNRSQVDNRAAIVFDPNRER